MKVFDWEQFWIDHPRKTLAVPGNENWANLRPKDYDYLKAFKEIDTVLQFQKTDMVLEVGCGTGEMLGFLALKMQRPLEQVVGVDFSQTMVDIARTNRKGYWIEKAPAHLLQFMDDTFDKVYMSGVIQHIAPPFFEQSIAEMLRVTKMGGRLFIGDVLEKADKSAEVFCYPKKVWEQFGKVEFFESGFEKRLNVVITKQTPGKQTFDNTKVPEWGRGNI